MPRDRTRIELTLFPFMSVLCGLIAVMMLYMMVILNTRAFDAKAASGSWYREAGTGMGATINTAVGMGAYVFTDRATWSSFKNRGDYKNRKYADGSTVAQQYKAWHDHWMHYFDERAKKGMFVEAAAP